MVRLLRVVVAGLAAACALSGCGDLQFRQDRRLTFLAPGDLEEVTLPVTVRWSIEGFQPTGADGSTSRTAGSFAVFVDRSPIKPGQSLRAVVGGDAGCTTVAADAVCPTPAQLRERDTYTTTEPSLVLDDVPPLPRGTGRRVHTITVVLLDGTGHRIGEAGWQRDLEIPDSKVRS